jgi:AbrB family looped-hinge helix DNA binding protein
LKKYPKLVQVDKRGQIVIPKDIRADLGIEEGTGFWVYSISNEGILLKKVEPSQLEDHKEILDELETKSQKISMKKDNIKKSVENYKKTKEGKLELL